MFHEPRRLAHLLASLEGSAEQTVGRLGDLAFTSHFQPIFSLSHACVVGHEALLRARDSHGQAVAPLNVFSACLDEKELAWCDNLSRIVHLTNFTASAPQLQWLFLNVHPDVFHMIATHDGDAYLRSIIAHLSIPGEMLVLEVLEHAASDPRAFEESIKIVRSHGCLIAIDDFGAGHSNFDRVWRLKPDIVKLDRSLIARAALDRSAQRVVSQMVSLLHECGALVLMEGIEIQEEAYLAMEADADLVQGFLFGRPQQQLMSADYAPETLLKLYQGLSQRRAKNRQQSRDRAAPYHSAIEKAGELLKAGRSMQEACQAFTKLPEAEMCYLLDSNGYQIGDHIWCADEKFRPQLAYAPLSANPGACWSRRPYFRRALESIGKVQITRPYRTLHGKHSCVTTSLAFQLDGDPAGEIRVICGDSIWSESDIRLVHSV